LTFSPKDINRRTGSLTFSDNATDSPQRVNLSGVGSEVGVSPNPVNFGSTQQNESVTLEIGSFYLDLAFQISVPQMCRRICRLVSFSRLLRAPRNLPCELLLWVRD
jgi:hypothetical protein